MPNQYEILQPSEIGRVLEHLHHPRFKNSARQKQNCAIFRLAACCGLRVGEIRELQIGDVMCDLKPPLIRIRKEATKRTAPIKGTSKKAGRSRSVPLNHDAGTLADIKAWKEHRKADGAGPKDPFICGQTCHLHGTVGGKITRSTIWMRWKRLMKAALGDERGEQLSKIHNGRAAFITHCLYASAPLPWTMRAVGHTSPGTTASYLQFVPWSPDEDIFGESLER